MDYVKLGRTGLDVSRICLGCMSYGGGNRGNHAWSLSEEESKPFRPNPGSPFRPVPP
jgi:aryl-alcohol dehydrogenase-like predicted oxidoreductase